MGDFLVSDQVLAYEHIEFMRVTFIDKTTAIRISTGNTYLDHVSSVDDHVRQPLR